jgi:uncharacterized membrane protein
MNRRWVVLPVIFAAIALVGSLAAAAYLSRSDHNATATARATPMATSSHVTPNPNATKQVLEV